MNNRESLSASSKSNFENEYVRVAGLEDVTKEAFLEKSNFILSLEAEYGGADLPNLPESENDNIRFMYESILKDAADLATALATKDEWTDLMEDLMEAGQTENMLGMDPLSVTDSQEIVNVARTSLPANVENNEVIDIQDFCDDLKKQVKCDVDFSNTSLKNGRYEIGLGTLGKIYIPKNPDPVKAKGAGHTPESYDGDNDPYIFQLELNGKTENFSLKDGYNDQGSALPSIVMRVNQAME